MSETPVRRQRATYSMPFKLDLVQKSLQPGASIARLAREHGINDNLLFTWRQRYRHLLNTPVDETGGRSGIDDNIVPVLVEHPWSTPPGPPAIQTPLPPLKPGQVCEVTLGRTRLTLSGNLTPAMLTALVRELKRGRR
ncbi:transposase (plasmid) [Enterobacter bugandensis]|uniref:IS66-like element accessory protein TnpA n=1 Tax=Enterobacter bugandensis TaxID=881260 RepID=UPI00283AA377|nr:transposase [Enterobacter bugandensis]WMU75482.1 transposase [Enterobacter bugandensis]